MYDTVYHILLYFSCVPLLKLSSLLHLILSCVVMFHLPQSYDIWYHPIISHFPLRCRDESNHTLSVTQECSFWSVNHSWLRNLQVIAATTPPLLSLSQSIDLDVGGDKISLASQSNSQTKSRHSLTSASSTPVPVPIPIPITPTPQGLKTVAFDNHHEISLLLHLPTATSIIDKELSQNLSLKWLFTSSSMGSAVGTSGPIGGIRDKRLRNALKSVMCFNPNGLTAGQTIFLASIQLLESIRVDGGTLDLTSLELYLTDTALDSCHAFRNALICVCDCVFSVFLEASSAVLRDSTGVPGSNQSNKHVPRIISLMKTRQTISTVFHFFLARCSHSVFLIRSTALRFTRQIFERMRWLVCDSTAVSLLLNSLNQISRHNVMLSQHPTTSSFSPHSVDGYHETSLPYRTVPHSLDPTLLPNALLPTNCTSVCEASLPLLELAYSWLFTGMRAFPSELSTVLQQYVLREQFVSHSSSSNFHLGIALAREAACNRSPIYHIAPPVGDTSLRGPRSIAALKISSELPPSSPSPSIEMNTIANAFTAQLAHKFVLRGELEGLLTSLSFSVTGSGHSGRAETNSQSNISSLIAGK